MIMSDSKWRKVTSAENIPPREGRCVEIKGRSIAIFHAQEGFLAVENRCPHRGGPLADGIVSGATVVCPLHAWCFDLRSGLCTNHPEAPGALKTYATRLEEGIVYVEVPQEYAPQEIAALAGEHRDRPIRWVHRRPLPAMRSGHFREGGSPLNADSARTEDAQGNGYGA